MERDVINTLDELRSERKKLRLVNAVTKQELAKSMGLMQESAKDFAIKKIAIPLGAAGIGSLVVKNLMEDGEEDKGTHVNTGEVHYHKNDGSSIVKKLLLALMPIGIKMLADIRENQEEEIITRYVE